MVSALLEQPLKSMSYTVVYNGQEKVLNPGKKTRYARNLSARVHLADHPM